MAEEERDPIMAWAHAEHTLQMARIKALAGLGLTEKTLKALRATAMEAMPSDVLVTEFGTVQVIPDRPVQWVPRKLEKGETVEAIFKSRLILLRNDEQQDT